MPYITKDKRERLEWIVQNLASELKSIGIKGNLNYVLYKLAKDICQNYSDFSDFEGDCQQSLKEIYRRLESKYEDEKIKINGDIE